MEHWYWYFLQKHVAGYMGVCRNLDVVKNVGQQAAHFLATGAEADDYYTFCNCIGSCHLHIVFKAGKNGSLIFG